MNGVVRRLGHIAQSIMKGKLPYVRWKPHPIDAEYGISTSSYVRRSLLATGDSTIDTNNVGYAGSQPSIVRHVIDLIPEKSSKVFVDLGCGKGRTLAVASEFPFQRIAGIEIVPKLVHVAKSNAAILRRRYPERTAIEVIEGDATDLATFGDGDLVLFLYNSFRGLLVERLIASITSTLERHPTSSIYLAYYNPVHFELFDNNSLFERFAADKLTYSAAEAAVRPFGNDYDSFVVYRAGRSGDTPPLQGHDRKVVVTQPELGAEVVV